MEGNEINNDCHKYPLQYGGICNYDVSSVFIDIKMSDDPAFVVSDVTQRRVEKLYETIEIKIKKLSEKRRERERERESWN